MKRLLFQFRMLRQARAKRLIVVGGLFVTVFLLLKTFTFPSRIYLHPKFQGAINPALDESRFMPSEDASITSLRVGKLSLLSDSRSPTDSSLVFKETGDAEFSDTGSETKRLEDDSEGGNDLDDDIDLDEEGDTDKEFSFDLGDGVMLKKGKDPVGGFITLERVTDQKHKVHIMDNAVEAGDTALVSDTTSIPIQSLVLEQTKSLDDESVPTKFTSIPVLSNRSSGQAPGEKGKILVNPSGQVSTETLDKDETSHLTTLNANFTGISSIPLVKKKRRMTPPVSVSEMNRLLYRNRASYRAMRPQWSSVRDKEMLAVKAQIENAPMVKTDRKLFAPVFRNISTFKRSYELMEKTLKVYVYKEGQKPIFHEPLLKGIYASEGWFMKQMESNKQYIVRNPKKAHLFYMPFSSRLLQFALYVPNSHSRKNMDQHLRNYVDSIASKYPFWNRTGGADHFLAACHDWAPSETRHTMARAIKALCVADLRKGFQLGKDVSLPETNVRSKNPLRDLGGEPAGSRSILAFFAGNLHGRLRPVLLQHWGQNRDPEMKVFGPLPRRAGRRAAYVNFMKSSKYCLCPRGYEANSPRVVESILFECVPVIIADNYVLPLFEVLNWEAFSVVVPEEDVPRLKEILASIPEEKYVSLQEGVRRVQQHFLWHANKPVKYDLFHMILHSIWFNRVHNVRAR